MIMAESSKEVNLATHSVVWMDGKNIVPQSLDKKQNTIFVGN